MARRELGLAKFRLLARFTLVLAVAATVAGLYAALHGQWGPAALGIGLGILLLYPSQYVAIKSEPGSEDQLVFVTKQECSLCDEARAILPTVTQGTPFRVTEQRLEEHAYLRRAFRNNVPVLLWQGEVVAELHWDPALVRTRLDQILHDRPAKSP